MGITNYLMSAVLLTTLIGIHSCTSAGNEKKKLLTKKWVYQEFKTSYDSATGEQLGNPIMEFQSDGTYKIVMGAVSLALGLESDQGAWDIKGNNLMLKSDVRGEHKFELQELSAEKAVLHSKLDSVDIEVFITLVPANGITPN